MRRLFGWPDHHDCRDVTHQQCDEIENRRRDDELKRDTRERIQRMRDELAVMERRDVH